MHNLVLIEQAAGEEVGVEGEGVGVEVNNHYQKG